MRKKLPGVRSWTLSENRSWRLKSAMNHGYQEIQRWLACALLIGGCWLLESPPLSSADGTHETYEEWWRFRGPNGSAWIKDGEAPEQWSDTDNLAWKTTLPGPGSSSAIVVKDRIFLTCFTGHHPGGDVSQLQRHLICLAFDNGEILWQRSIPADSQEDRYMGQLRQHGYATSTPASDGHRVYVFFGKSGVVAYDLDGEQLWRSSVGTGSAKMRWGSGSSPIVYENLVIINAAAESRSIVALDKLTGKEVWRMEAPALYGSWATPVLVETADKQQVELVLSAPYEVWGFNPRNGDFLWYAPGIQDETVCGSLITHGDVVYAIGGRAGSATAIRAGGKDDVEKTHVLWKSQVSSYVPSPVLAGDRIYCVNERGILACISVTDGTILFQRRLDNARNIYASPLVVGRRLYVVTRTDGTHVLSTEGQAPTLAINHLSDSTDFNASPVYAQRRLLLRSQQTLYCVGSH